MPPAAPPAVRRSSVSDVEVTELSERLGATAPLQASDVRALLDPRGHRFERLEWLGDSILDHVVAHHRLRASWNRSSCCAGRSQATIVSDDDLAECVRATGLVDLLDWVPSVSRQADLVEACLAAAWLAGGWRGAAAAAAVLVHPPLADDVDALLSGTDPHAPEPPCDSARFRQTAELGSYVLEASASAHLVATHPGSEGELSARRAVLLAGRRLAPRAPVGGCGGGGAAHRVDHVQSRVGVAQLRGGARQALAVAATCLALDAPGDRVRSGPSTR